MISVFAAATLGNESVVVIARAAVSQSQGFFASIFGRIYAIFSPFSGSPMTPVDANRTSFLLIPLIFASASRDISIARVPSLPLKAFACPAFMSIALALGFLAMACLDHITGAAGAVD